MNKIFTYTWKVFSKNIIYIMMLSSPFILIEIFSNVISVKINESNTLLFWLINTFHYISFSIFTCASILFISQEFLNELHPVKANIIESFIYAPLVIFAIIVASSPLIIAFLLLYKSSSLLILFLSLSIVGVYVTLKTSFSPYLIMLEGDKPISAIINSFQYTKGLLGKMFILMFIFVVTTSIIENLCEINSSFEPLNTLLIIVSSILTTGIYLMLQIALFKLYVDRCKEIKLERLTE